MNRSIEELKHFGEEAIKVSTAVAGISGLGGILAGGGVLAGLGMMAERAAENVESQIKLSQELGVTTERLSQLQYAATVSNVSTEELERSMLKLSRALGGAESSVTHSAVAFEKWGLSARELASKDIVGAFEDVAEKIKNTSDATERSALAFAVFGRQGQRLMPLLSQGKEGIEALRAEADSLGVTLTEKGAEGFEKMERASKKLKAAWDALAKTAIVEFAPTLETIITYANAFTALNILGARKLGILPEAEGKAAEEKVDPFAGAKKAIEDIGKLKEELDRKFSDKFLAGSGLDEFQQSIKKLREQLGGIAENSKVDAALESLEKHAGELNKKLVDQRKELERIQELEKSREQLNQRLNEIFDETLPEGDKIRRQIEEINGLRDRIGEDAAGKKFLDIIKGFEHSAGLGNQPGLPKAVLRGTAEDAHVRAVNEASEKQVSQMDRIAELLRILGEQDRAKLRMGEQIVDGLQHLGIVA